MSIGTLTICCIIYRLEMFVIDVYYPFFQGTILTGNTCVTVLVIGGVEVFKMINTIETVLCRYFVDTSDKLFAHLHYCCLI